MSKEAYIRLFQNAVQLNTVYASKFRQANFLFTCERSVNLIAFRKAHGIKGFLCMFYLPSGGEKNFHEKVIPEKR